MATLQTVQRISTRLKRRAKLFVYRNLLIPRLVFFVIGLAIINTGQANSIKFNRVESTKVTCEFTYSGFLRKQISSVSFEELQDADISIESKYFPQEDGGEDYYRIFVLTQNSKVPISDWDTYAEVQSKLVAIKAFLNDPEQKPLSFGTDSRPISYPVGSIIFLMGVFVRKG